MKSLNNPSCRTIGFPTKDDNWSWNTDDKSYEVLVTGRNNRTAHFHPNWAYSTAGVRGTKILNGKRAYWEITTSEKVFGTSMMFGIGTKKARLHIDGFTNMLGMDENSWGLNHNGFTWHNNSHKKYTKPFTLNTPTTIGLLFDGISGSLTFFKDSINLGIAFSNLHKVSEPLLPIVCSTAADTKMSLGNLKRDYHSLQDRCCSIILTNLTNKDHINKLEVPYRLKQLIYKEAKDMQDNRTTHSGDLSRF